MDKKRTDSQRAAEARYNAKRRGRPTVVWRMTEGQADWLRQQQQSGESRAAALARLLGVTDL
jgi:predicted ArsR family transcriptional regulator